MLFSFILPHSADNRKNLEFWLNYITFCSSPVLVQALLKIQQS